MNTIIYGDYINGSAVIYEKRNRRLVKGLAFNDGRKWFSKANYFGDFHCGLACADFDRNSGYLNRNAEWCVPPVYEFCDAFTEDRSYVIKDGSFSLIDNKGNHIKNFDDPDLFGHFNEGIARVYQIHTNSLKTEGFTTRGFIDLDGNFIISNPDKYISEDLLEKAHDYDDFSEGLIRIKHNGKYGFVDVNLNIKIPFIYDWAAYFKNGVAGVSKNGKSGFIDKNNETVIPFLYDNVRHFGDNVVSVNRNGKWGAIDINNKTIIDFIYDDLGIMTSDGIEFCLNNKWGIMNVNEKIIVPCKFDKINNFHEGICKVLFMNKNGVVDRNGSELFSDESAGDYPILN